MIVEFIGESGCGKSTLAKKVAQNVEDVKVKVSLSRGETLKAFGQILLQKKCRKLLFSLLSLDILTNGYSRLLKNAYYLVGLINAQCESEKASDVCVLMEQGIIQFLHSIFFEKMPINNKYSVIIQNLMEQWDYYVVYCHCEHQILKKRIMQRRDNFMETNRRIEHADIETFKFHDRIFSLFVGCISESRYIDIDTEDDCLANAAHVGCFISHKRSCYGKPKEKVII